ncbi:hypothetical protein AB0E74_20340 [Streptomyces sp. NPDC030392]|uniref:hypothetical protein n=1 Tax=Streptomyces sp. NPDC030392 TaxID=3155468 RepID=UPI00340CC434
MTDTPPLTDAVPPQTRGGSRRRGSAPFFFVVLESAVTVPLALGWLLLSLAMRLEAATAVPGAPVPDGHEGLGWSAGGVLVSVALTWLLRLAPGHVTRHAVDGVVALRLPAVLIVTAVLLVDLLAD